MDLTEIKFWEDYWAKCELPSTVDQGFSFDRCLAKALKDHLPVIKGDALEIGCAPGKWLAYMASEFSLRPNGIEYSEAGTKATIKNFRLLGLEAGRILVGDFFQMVPEQQFDVVMSFGFIEHFSDADSVVEAHLRWLKPGGVLVLGVPNFQGVYHFLQRILNKEILDKHNLDIMRPGYFEHLAVRFGLEQKFIGYIGSFEPSLPVPSQRHRGPIQIMVRLFLTLAHKFRKARWMDSFNNPWISSYLLAVYLKGERR